MIELINAQKNTAIRCNKKVILGNFLWYTCAIIFLDRAVSFLIAEAMTAICGPYRPGFLFKKVFHALNRPWMEREQTG